MQTLALALASIVLLAVGFAGGYLTRELISRRRRWRVEKAEELWR